MTSPGDEQRICTNTECQERINELLQVNSIWSKDYGELMKQNQQLKAALANTENSRSLTGTKSPVNIRLQQGSRGSNFYSSITVSPSQTTNLQVKSSMEKSPSNPDTTSGSSSIQLIDLSSPTTSLSLVGSPLYPKATGPSSNSSPDLSPINHRKQYEDATTSYSPSTTHSETRTTFSRSNCTNQEERDIDRQQSEFHRTEEKYMQCSVAYIEKIKEQIRAFKDQYEREREEKEKEKEKNRNLKRRLKETEEITHQLHQRIDNLEKKLMRTENEKTNLMGTCDCEQQRKAELMGREVFPKDDHEYKEERDTIPTRYQQSPHHHRHHESQREFEGGTVDQKYQKFRQIYPLIY